MQLTRYDNAKQAVAEYKTVDEIKDFRDKAVAVEAYARQALDFDLERDAAIARVRAERRCGELLRDMEKAKGAAQPGIGRAGNNAVVNADRIDKPKTLSEMGLTKGQSSKWQKLAAVPEEEFEAVLADPGKKPSGEQVLKTNGSGEPDPKPPRINKQALWLWGRLRDMEQDGVFDEPLSFYLDEMTDAMRAEMDRIIPTLRKWLNENR